MAAKKPPTSVQSRKASVVKSGIAAPRKGVRAAATTKGAPSAPATSNKNPSTEPASVKSAKGSAPWRPGPAKNGKPKMPTKPPMRAPMPKGTSVIPKGY